MCPLSYCFKSLTFWCRYVRLYIANRRAIANVDCAVLTINCAHMQLNMVDCCILKVTVLKECSPRIG